MKNLMLKALIGVCLVFALFKVVDFSLDHIPPYNEDECFVLTKVPVVKLKVLHNDLVEGTSLLKLSVGGHFRFAKTTFSDLRGNETAKVECK